MDALLHNDAVFYLAFLKKILQHFHKKYDMTHRYMTLTIYKSYMTHIMITTARRKFHRL